MTLKGLDGLPFSTPMLAPSGRPPSLPPRSELPSVRPPSFDALASCPHDGCGDFQGWPVSVGEFVFDVRKLPGAAGTYGVWRCGVALGLFVVTADGAVEVRSTSDFFLDEVLVRLVAEELRLGLGAPRNRP